MAMFIHTEVNCSNVPTHKTINPDHKVVTVYTIAAPSPPSSCARDHSFGSIGAEQRISSASQPCAGTHITQ